MVTLVCAIVGVSGSAFPVTTDARYFVKKLKDDIKTKISRRIPCDANKLQLFPAKMKIGTTKTKDGKWLSSSTEDVKKLKKGEKTSHVVELTEEVRELQVEDSIANFLAGMETPTARQIHVLVVVPEKIEVLGNEKKRKRADDDALDVWMDAIKDEQVTVLPLTCEDLREYLQRPLRIKIPIYERHFELISAHNATGKCTRAFYKLFEPEPRKIVGYESITIVGDFVSPRSHRSGAYYYLWDSLIAKLLERVANGRYCRYMKASTSADLYRPDLCFYYGKSNVCVFRGEEKASGALEVPVEELHDKLIWKYDAASYIFGYAAVGLQVRLVAIRRDEMTERDAKVEIIETYDLDDLSSRLLFFLALLNLSTLFRPVVNLIPSLDVREYGTMKRGNGVQISFAENCVVKTFPSDMPSDSIIQNLKDLHGRMKEHSVPNVVQLMTGNMKKRHVTLSPVGRLAVPENAHQLLTALRDILKALVALHAINIMHRDLRWENVLKYQGEDDKWFLIDFDDGALSPAANVEHLKAESHAPETLSCSTHTVKVDIWSVGYLIKTSNIVNLPANLETIKVECLQNSPEKRPTAESLFDTIEKLLGAA
ncbi:hypothetical protein DD237_002525 [Peronospora effusa]|uniref:Protein kinase domain-containing protein n=1 Tax=Peronospora effusa TaxID=542832 RepID=A0A425CJF3_9STRA|nr:hypothetical protein DD237_002525 [Peronospora effusa]